MISTPFKDSGFTSRCAGVVGVEIGVFKRLLLVRVGVVLTLISAVVDSVGWQAEMIMVIMRKMIHMVCLGLIKRLFFPCKNDDDFISFVLIQINCIEKAFLQMMNLEYFSIKFCGQVWMMKVEKHPL